MKITVPRCLTISVPPRRWFVLRVRPSYSDSIFEKLAEAGYSVYLPRHRYDKFNRRMRVLVERSNPLMAGYLFLVHPRQGQSVDDWSEVRAIDGVLSPLRDDRGPLLIPEIVIEKITAAEFSSTYDDTQAAKKMRGETERAKMEERFKPGGQFQVNDGPFASFLGVVDSLTEDDRVKMLLDIFGRFVPVDFNADQLDDSPVKPKAA
jgi:transcription antitermination factor NusG